MNSFNRIGLEAVLTFNSNMAAVAFVLLPRKLEVLVDHIHRYEAVRLFMASPIVSGNLHILVCGYGNETNHSASTVQSVLLLECFACMKSHVLAAIGQSERTSTVTCPAPAFSLGNAPTFFVLVQEDALHLAFDVPPSISACE